MAKTDKINNDLDLSNISNGLWLVKVPKYIQEKWQNAPSDMVVGKLRMSSAVLDKPKISLTLPPEVMELKPDGSIPTEHILDVSVTPEKKFGIFSVEEEKCSDVKSSDISVKPENKFDAFLATIKKTIKDNNNKKGSKEIDKVCLEGQIVEKLECRPNLDDTYISYKNDCIRKSRKLKMKYLEKVVQNYKPIVVNSQNKESRDRKIKQEKKVRDEKDCVLEMLFGAFEEQQYYNTKELAKITQQPVRYLREILKEMCDYNTKNPHRNMWELKKEYRHYKSNK